jgi:hypothetical protein
MGPAAGVDDEAKGWEPGREPEAQPVAIVRTVVKAANDEAKRMGASVACICLITWYR